MAPPTSPRTPFFCLNEIEKNNGVANGTSLATFGSRILADRRWRRPIQIFTNLCAPVKATQFDFNFVYSHGLHWWISVFELLL